MANDGIALRIKTLDNRIRRTMDMRTRVRDMGLTPEQLFIIGYLSKHEGTDIYQRDFENEFKVTRATVSNTLSIMEKKGLILRESVPHDARLKKLTLTEEAKSVHSRAAETISEINNALTSALTEEEIIFLMRTFDKLEEALNHFTEEQHD